MTKEAGIVDHILKNLESAPPVLVVLYKVLSVLLIALLLWMLLRRIVASLEKRLSSYTFVRENRQIFPILNSAFTWLLLFFTGTYLIRLFKWQSVETVFFAFIIIAIAGPLKDFLVLFLVYLEKNISDKTKTKVDDVIFDLLNKFSGVIIYITAFILALDIMGINVMPFIAGAGVMGIAIGFAAKDTLSNLIAGVLLIIDRPFEVGDRIEVWSAPMGSATWGDVIDIGLRATKIRTTDNIIIIIPNNEIMMRDIVNYTIITSKIRVRVNIGIAYDANLSRAKEIILEVADAIEWILKDPPPKVMVTAFGESSVDLQLRAWIGNARRRMDTISRVTDQVKDAFDREGIEIPYPKRDITIINKTNSPA